MPCFDLSLRVRSGLIASQLCPSFVDLNRTLRAGVQRRSDRAARTGSGSSTGSGTSSPPRRSPSDCRARRLTSRMLAGAMVVAREQPAVRSARRRSANSSGSGAIQPLSPPPTSYQSLAVMPPAGRAAGDAHGRVVLLRAVDVVREIVVQRDAIELRGRLVLLRGPASGRRRSMTFAPPSLPSIIRCGSFGAIQRSWLSPCGVPMRLTRPCRRRSTCRSRR